MSFEVLPQVARALDLAVIERLPNAGYFMVAPPPPWLEGALEENATLARAFPFLRHFLETAGAAWHDGATVAGSSAGASVLCDPMVDPRGGAYTLGLGLIGQLALIPHADTWSEDKRHRTLQLAPKGLPVVAIDERTALIRSPAGTWQVGGAGHVHVYLDGQEQELTALP